VHSFLFILIGICTIYVFITAVLDHINWLAGVTFSVAVIELLVLVFNEWRCPLTDLAERKGAEVGSVADLFLPKWLFDRLFPIFGITFFVTCLLLVWRVAV
jgi:hypothetical protein